MASPSIIQKPLDFNFSEDPIYLIVESDKFVGGDAPYTATESNLSCYLEVWEYDDVNDTNILLVVLTAPYNQYTKQATFDVSSIKSPIPHLPNLNETNGKARNVYGFIWFKVADQFGIPVLPGEFTVEKNEDNYFKVIYGSARQTIGDFQKGFPLHAYKDLKGNFISKEITKDQPDWLYFWLDGNDLVNVKVTTNLFFSDGTNDIAAYIQDVNLAGNSVNWVSTGYRDRVVPAQALKTVISYNVIVSVPTEFSTNFIAYQGYIIDKATDHDKYIAVFNGLGGVESVRMRGEFSSDYDVKRSTFQRTQWGSVNNSVGLISFYNQKGIEKIKMNTGYYEMEYIYLLRQLLLGETWILNLLKKDFHAVVCESTKIKEVRSSDKFIGYIDITYSDSIVDKFANLLHVKP